MGIVDVCHLLFVGAGDYGYLCTVPTKIGYEGFYSGDVFIGMVDRILTGEMFARSKPAPDCFLLGMEIFEATPENSYVFEDSFHGLQAGMTSGATVIGLATTNSREAITGKAHYIIDDFTGMTYEKMISLHK